VKIGVISDTHIPGSADGVPAKVFELFAGVDLILHAGDLVEWRVIEQLGKIARVEAVRGNMDSPDVTRRLPPRKVLELGGKKIGLIHGSGKPVDLRSRIRNEFARDGVDIIVYGHSHTPFKGKEGDIFFFNPGSPTDHVFARVNAVGILEIGDTVEAKIIEFSKE
jgi:putative phosphoesterase